MKKFLIIGILVSLAGSFAFSQSTKVKIETSKGTMTIMLYDETPLHRDNFIKLVKEGFYNDLLFHRVIKNFMIQGGDPNSKNAPEGAALGNGGPGYTIPAEFNTKYFHKKGALSAARLGDQVNPQKESSGSQFYVVQGLVYTDMQLDQFENRMNVKYTKAQRDTYTTIGGAPYLDSQYTVFGEVIDGLDVIDKIASVETLPGDRPKEDVKILNVTIIK
ncbi:MAG: peptidylprolyl isomerase [Bacteroidales bacterium]|jgi:peptidyl-prolyl cis-trans isomerase B (cyclophilin B)|nr:peptidylprolyl isomerase [Bacteroidales bacterium]